MQKSVQKILYRHSFAADFCVWGGSFGEVVCVFEVFVIAFCFGEFVGVFVLRFLCFLLVEIERVMKRWDFYNFCCSFFFPPGFFGWGLFWWVAQISRWWMKKLLLWSSQVFLGPVDGKSGAKQASCKGFWPNPTTLLCFSFFLVFFFWECLECFGRQNSTKELQLWKRQNQSTQSISLINPSSSSSSSSSSFPQISKK